MPPKETPRSALSPVAVATFTVKRYKVRLRRFDFGRFDSGPRAFESWIVFDVIGDATIILLKHATTNGYGKWWDHPLLSSKACRIIQADGGDSLVDCQRVRSAGRGEPLRIVLPQGAFLHDCLITFAWEESGRIQEGVLRIEKGLIPDMRRTGENQKPEEIRQPRVDSSQRDGTAPPGIQPRVADSRGWRYKVKLSPGSAWRNLRPESWVVFDVIGGATITLRHSTNVMNIITGFSRWWDHSVRSITACPLFVADVDNRQAGCLIGSSASPGGPLQIMLPEGASIHDYVFTFTWEEGGKIEEAVTSVDRIVEPIPIPPR
ncbi:hypothetical protein [Synechococcus sp. GFB01]|uniref:hypothetical protein n=1 Tax=Synechococcus sp. GFB01 TaxID=1662190 RepID=UPI00128E698E|nr:hypothetical protein [Synechococcus sp. GFB01]